MECDKGVSREIFKRPGICFFPMIGDPESRGGVSPMLLTFRRGEVDLTVGILKNA
jgi:hypothetical protein